jgi:hypothetical protein
VCTLRCRSLHLSFNQLSGSFPESYSTLTALTLVPCSQSRLDCHYTFKCYLVVAHIRAK